MYCLLFVEWTSNGFPYAIAACICTVWCIFATVVVWIPSEGNVCVLPFGGCVIQYIDLTDDVPRFVLNCLSLGIWLMIGVIISTWYARIAVNVYHLKPQERTKKIYSIISTLCVTCVFMLCWLPCIIMACMMSAGRTPHRDKAYLAQILIMMNGLLQTIFYGATDKDYRETFRELCFVSRQTTVAVSYPTARAKENRKGILHRKSKFYNTTGQNRSKNTRRIAVASVEHQLEVWCVLIYTLCDLNSRLLYRYMYNSYLYKTEQTHNNFLARYRDNEFITYACTNHETLNKNI